MVVGIESDDVVQRKGRKEGRRSVRGYKDGDLSLSQGVDRGPKVYLTG